MGGTPRVSGRFRDPGVPMSDRRLSASRGRYAILKGGMVLDPARSIGCCWAEPSGDVLVGILMGVGIGWGYLALRFDAVRQSH